MQIKPGSALEKVAFLAQTGLPTQKKDDELVDGQLIESAQFYLNIIEKDTRPYDIQVCLTLAAELLIRELDRILRLETQDDE